MKNIPVVCLFLFGTLFLNACSLSTQCEKPYIKVGSECCVDQNDNKVCDKDEIELDNLRVQKDITRVETVPSADGKTYKTDVIEGCSTIAECKDVIRKMGEQIGMPEEQINEIEIFCQSGTCYSKYAAMGEWRG